MSIEIKIDQWEKLEAHAYTVRKAVFIDEQKVPASIELDDQDALSLHAVAYNAEQQPIGTARLLTDGHIGRMAVLKEARGQGVGAMILKSLIDEAKEQGHQSVALSAQTHAIPFYEKFGFVAEGPVYKDADIDHKMMRLNF